MKKFLTVIIVVGLAAEAWYFWSSSRISDEPSDTPQSVITYTNASSDLIELAAPAAGASVRSPFVVTGEARGTWYFEASFPVLVRAEDGTILTQVPAQAQSDWMTEEKVPFSVTLDLGSYTGPATLILKKDNPSGEARFDASISLPIMVELPVAPAATTTETE